MLHKLWQGDAAMLHHVFHFLENEILHQTMRYVCKEWNAKVNDCARIFETTTFGEFISKKQYLYITTNASVQKYLKNISIASPHFALPICTQFASQVQTLNLSINSQEIIQSLASLNFPNLRHFTIKTDTMLIPYFAAILGNCPKIQVVELLLRLNRLEVQKDEWFLSIVPLLEKVREVHLKRVNFTMPILHSVIQKHATFAQRVSSVTLYGDNSYGLEVLSKIPNVTDLMLRFRDIDACNDLTLLRSISNSWKSCTKLTRLGIHSVKATGAACDEFFASIPSTVVELYISDCEFSHFPNIKHLTELECLDLATCTFDNFNGVSLASMLKLKAINFGFVYKTFTPLPAKFIPLSTSSLNLAQFSKLTSSAVENTSIKELTLEYFNDTEFPLVWKHLASSLQQLTIRSTKAAFTINDESMQALHRLHTFTASNANEFALHVMSKLNLLSSIRHIDLSNNKLNIFPAELMVIPALEELYLRRNEISLIPDALLNGTCMCKLTTLDVSANKLVHVPNFALCSSLKTVRLTDMQFETKGDEYLPPSVSLVQLAANVKNYLREECNATFLDKTIPFAFNPLGVIFQYAARLPHGYSVCLRVIRSEKNDTHYTVWIELDTTCQIIQNYDLFHCYDEEFDPAEII